MTPIDLVYNTVYKRCLAAGCIERVAQNAAVDSCTKYKNNQFKSFSSLIDTSVADAKKLIIKKRKNKLKSR